MDPKVILPGKEIPPGAVILMKFIDNSKVPWVVFRNSYPFKLLFTGGSEEETSLAVESAGVEIEFVSRFEIDLELLRDTGEAHEFNRDVVLGRWIQDESGNRTV